VPVELDIDSGDAAIVGARALETEHGARWTLTAAPGPEAVITVGTTRLVILDATSGSRVWAGSIAGERVVALWDGGMTFAHDHATLERWGAASEVLTIPALEGSAGRVGPFQRLALPAVDAPASLVVHEVAAATSLPETRRGGPADRYSAPRDAEYAAAAVFEVDVPLDDDFAGAQIVSLEWAGDVARAWVGDELVSDQFWYGRPWEIDARLLPQLAASPLRIEILPWNGDADFFVDRRVRADRVAGRADVLSATLIRAPHLRVGLAP
jgi:beta-galactosidase